MEFLEIVNLMIALIFFVCYAYQFAYIPISLIKKRKPMTISAKENRFAVLICARNEAAVIGDLIDSIHEQTYQSDLVTVFVMADNCTDDTAKIAESMGAKVYTRFNREFVGKGYALQELMRSIKRDYDDAFDGFFVFDADNILTSNYIENMNLTFSNGGEIVTSYRNSKNFGDNWISAGYALWFLRESRYLNNARSLLGTSCAVSGTGFLFSRKVANDIVDWPFHMLTEDIEFSVDQIVKGRKIEYCPNAEFYDEQPDLFSQSWDQRKRWAKGYMQVFGSYGKRLIKGVFSGSFACFDMAMSIMPAFILSMLSIICNVAICIVGIGNGVGVMPAIQTMAQTFLNMYMTLFVIGSITTISEWKHIEASTIRKIYHAFTFPIFMFTYMPISFAAFFGKGEWKPIKHSVSAKQMRLKRAKSLSRYF